MSVVDEIDENLQKENDVLDEMVQAKIGEKGWTKAQKKDAVLDAAKVRNMVDTKLRKEKKTLSDKEKAKLKEKSKQLNKAVIRGGDIDIDETNRYIDEAKKLV